MPMTRKYCLTTSLKKMGFSQRASCKSQGFIKRTSKKFTNKYFISEKYKKYKRKLKRSLKKRISHPRRSVRRSKNRRSISKKRISHPRRSIRRSKNRRSISKKRISKIYDGVESCPKCTYDNPDNSEKCVICDSQLPKIKCPTCTYDNPVNSDKCVICESQLPKIKCPKKVEEKKDAEDLKLVRIKPDGFCSLYAIMFSYLCIPRKEPLLNNKGDYIKNIEEFINFLDDYINTRINSNLKELGEITDVERKNNLLLENMEMNILKIQINNKKTGTIETEILWKILTEIFHCNIEIYNKVGKVGKEGKDGKVLIKYTYKEGNCVIRIYTDLSHYNSIVNTKITIDNIPINAKTWLDNMININYTGRETVESEEFKSTYTFDVSEEFVPSEYSEYSEYKKHL